MAKVEILMPQMGESIIEATVLEWLKKVGDEVSQEESLLEVATDKVDTEVPSPYEGVLKELLVEKGDIIEIGKPIAVIETYEEEPESSNGHDNGYAVSNEPEPVGEKLPNGQETLVTADERFYSPLVKNIAKAEKISGQELAGIPGSGLNNRVTKKDIMAYLDQRKQKEKDSLFKPAGTENYKVSSTATNNLSIPPVTMDEKDEIVEMDRMRKLIADRMLASRRISAHVSSFVEADVTGLMSWRDKVKEEFRRKEKEKLTLTPIFIEAVVKAIKDYPMVNVSVDGYRIIKRKAINVGMAVALEDGNLIVPVIHDADQLSLVGLAAKVNDMARRARENKLKPEELSGGTYTITNIGTFGNIAGTPIILQPQVAILALGAVQKKASVIETKYGDMLGIRQKMILSHSYDHRVIDGSLGGLFVKRVADYLEDFDEERKW